MASITIDVPDALVPDLSRALALRMGVAEPTTNAERAALARAFLKEQAKQALLDYRAQQAAQAKRDDASDPAVSW